MRGLRVQIGRWDFDHLSVGSVFRHPQDTVTLALNLIARPPLKARFDDDFLADQRLINAFPDSRDRWLYTGITRAATRITIVR